MIRRSGLKTVVALVTVALGTSMVFGASLVSIGVLDAGDPLSKVNAISLDGTYAVGSSNNASVSYPVIWSLADGLVQLPNDAEIPSVMTEARGVIVRSGGLGFPDIIGVCGHSPSGFNMHFYETTVDSLAGGAWEAAVGNYLAGPYNSSRLYLSGSGDWYTGGANNAHGKAVRCRYAGPGNGAADFQGGSGEQMANSISGTRVGVGFHSPAATHEAAYWTAANNDAGFHSIAAGAAGTWSEGLGISNDGSTMCGFVGLSATTGQGFIWQVGDALMTPIGRLAGDTHAVAIAVNAAKVAVGFSSDGAPEPNERAVIWDSTGLWDNTGLPLVLKDVLADAGVDVSDWSTLMRATSISDDGKTVAGWGVWNDDGSTRGFVAKMDAVAVTPPSIADANSVKTHGGAGDFSVDLWDAGASTGNTEGREGGPTSVVVQFDKNIQRVTNTLADVLMVNGTVNALAVAGDTLTVTVSGVANGVLSTMTFPGIATDSSPAQINTQSLCIRPLVGDADGTGAVNIFDLIQIRNNLNQAVVSGNFRNDVTADGNINIFDLIATRNALNITVLGCP